MHTDNKVHTQHYALVPVQSRVYAQWCDETWAVIRNISLSAVQHTLVTDVNLHDWRVVRYVIDVSTEVALQLKPSRRHQACAMC